ncbi:hypothetical protein TNCV_1014341 [Trichonephila clavipes]|uniref:Uncharacterized protein n=1 Tax=Trichonephila clavipes TaxID=2585209 RepID=A0A8X6VXX9_TRICX|nr:hypothetical protein TNCV_1014341 [Trichonephila clavipes]
MKCNYLQAKLNKRNKEYNLLQKQLAEYKKIPQKRSTEFLPTNEPYKGLADLNENNFTHLDYHHLDIATKLQPKKILKERNRETVNPYNLLSRAKKQEMNEERKDKAKETKRQIEKLVGEPEYSDTTYLHLHNLGMSGLCTRDSAHKTFGPTDLTVRYSVCIRRVFGGIEPRPSGLESDALNQWSPNFF